MHEIELAGGPVSWGVDFAEHPDNPPYPVVLEGIAAAGLRWLELGPTGYLPRDSAPALADRGLAAIGTFVFDAFHDRSARAVVLAAADAALEAVVAAGGSLLVLIDRPCEARARTAGRSDSAPRLAPGAWAQLVSTFRLTAERAAERGVRAVVHPHAGGYVEFEDELERLLDDVPGEELGLCLDTGHALYAGSDPAELILRHRERLAHLHLKDVRGAVRARSLGFWDAIAAGVFCPVGEGEADLVAIRCALAAAGYRGFATVEQDRVPGATGSPGDDLRRSVERLRAVGIG